MEKFPRRVKRYIWLSFLPAAVVVALAAAIDHRASVALPWLLYPVVVAVVWLGEEYRVLTRKSINLTMTAAVHLPLILLFTPLEAILLAAASCLCSQLRRRRSFYRAAYNAVVRVIAIGVPALGLALWRFHNARFSGNRAFLDADVLLGIVREPGTGHLVRLAGWPHFVLSAELMAGSVLAALLYFALDSGLFVTVVAVQTSASPLVAWRANMRATILPEITKSVIGIIAACVYVVNPFFVALVALPVAVTHVTTKAILRLERETIDAVTALADAIDYRDPYTAQHSVRVAELSRRLARRLGLTAEQVDGITLAARVHDLGKIGIPNDILLKPGRLDASEMAVMQQHPRIGAEVLQKYHNFRDALPIVLHHHERYDGNGYPDGLAGDAIPLGAHIVAHADSWDAMTSDRPYRTGLRPEVALLRIAESSGTQFDPAVAGAFVAMMREELAAAGQFLPQTGGSLAEPALAPAAGGEEKVRYLYK